MVPCVRDSCCDSTKLGSTGMIGTVPAKVVIALSMAVADPGQSGAPPEVVGQQWCRSSARRCTRRDEAGVFRFISGCAAEYACAGSWLAKYGDCAVEESGRWQSTQNFSSIGV